MRLGYDTYSVRAWNWKALQHLEFAAKLGLNAIQLSSVGDYESLDPAHLARVRENARQRAIVIDAGTGCICPTSKSYNQANGDPVEYLLKGLRVAQAVGARTLRCFLGSSEDRYDGKGIEYHIESTLKVFRAARAAALDTGVKIALENHSGDMQAWELKDLIEQAGRDYVGACLDTGNPIWCAEHPEVALEVLAPYTVTTRCRDTAIWEHPRGCAAHWTALGDGSIDLAKLGAMQKSLCPQAPLHLEIITDAPGMKEPKYLAALKRQQMVDLERSLRYAQQKMI